MQVFFNQIFFTLNFQHFSGSTLARGPGFYIIDFQFFIIQLRSGFAKQNDRRVQKKMDEGKFRFALLGPE